MVKLFRSARQNLFSEGKSKIYFRLAVVEIFLIMVGILLALQLDNWNETRKLRIIQNEALVKLESDLGQDIKRYNDLDSTYNSWLHEADYILNEVLNGSTPYLTSKEEFHVGRGSMYYITLNMSTYNEMINTGILYEFKNQDLSKRIIDYYDYSSFELEKLNTDNHDFFQWTLNRSSFDTFTILFRLRENRYTEYLNWDWLQDPNSILFKELEAKIFYFRSAILANLEAIELLRHKATLTLGAIKEYLLQ